MLHLKKDYHKAIELLRLTDIDEGKKFLDLGLHTMNCRILTKKQ